MSGAHIAIHAAAQAAESIEREEMEMTNYTEKDLAEEWEFKILRNVSDAFKKPHVLQKVAEEEAVSGWVLVEKFDNKRLRFKRSMSARRNDATLPPGVDPYRTQYGINSDKLGMLIAGGILSLGFLIIGILAATGKL